MVACGIVDKLWAIQLAAYCRIYSLRDIK